MLEVLAVLQQLVHLNRGLAVSSQQPNNKATGHYTEAIQSSIITRHLRTHRPALGPCGTASQAQVVILLCITPRLVSKPLR